MKKYFPLILILGLAAVITTVSLLIPRPKVIDWSDGFEKNQKKPFGTYILHDLLSQNKKNFKVENRHPYDFYEENYNTIPYEERRIWDSIMGDWYEWESEQSVNYYWKTDKKANNDLYEKEVEALQKEWGEKISPEPEKNYILITNDYSPDSSELDLLCKYILRGNNVFISSKSFNDAFLERFDWEKYQNRDNDYKYYFHNSDYGTVGEKAEQIKTREGLENQLLSTGKTYKLNRANSANTFLGFNADRYEILGTVSGADGKQFPNYLRLSWGFGNLYIHTSPYAFSNYSLLNKNEHGLEYASNALAPLNVNNSTWIWSHPVLPRGGEAQSPGPLKYIMSKPALAWAFYLTTAGAILYVLFMGKRRQRAIPALLKPKNDTLEFVNITSKFYFRSGAAKSVALKMSDYFLESVRQKYYLTVGEPESEFNEQLALKMNVPLFKVTSLMNFIQQIRRSDEIHRKDLVTLHDMIADLNETSETVSASPMPAKRFN